VHAENEDLQKKKDKTLKEIKKTKKKIYRKMTKYLTKTRRKIRRHSKKFKNYMFLHTQRQLLERMEINGWRLLTKRKKSLKENVGNVGSHR